MMRSCCKKNIYANTDHYYLCFWTSLGIHCALNTENLSAHEFFFLGVDSKVGSAGGWYQEQLLGLVAHHREEVMTHIGIDYINAYGLRKGSATLAVSGTTNPPPISSVARRGEWSMVKVLDVYWHFFRTWGSLSREDFGWNGSKETEFWKSSSSLDPSESNAK